MYKMWDGACSDNAQKITGLRVTSQLYNNGIDIVVAYDNRIAY